MALGATVDGRGRLARRPGSLRAPGTPNPRMSNLPNPSRPSSIPLPALLSPPPPHSLHSPHPIPHTFLCRYQEKFYFSPGDTGFKTFDTAYGRIGALICWDQWFPEGARCLALQGAELLFYPTAIGSEPPPAPPVSSYPHWQRVMAGHSGASMVPVIAANRIGTEKFEKSEITFYGGSFITNETGAVVAQVGAGPCRDLDGAGPCVGRQADRAKPLDAEARRAAAAAHHRSHACISAGPTPPSSPFPLPRPGRNADMNMPGGRQDPAGERRPRPQPFQGGGLCAGHV